MMYVGRRGSANVSLMSRCWFKCTTLLAFLQAPFIDIVNVVTIIGVSTTYSFFVTDAVRSRRHGSRREVI